MTIKAKLICNNVQKPNDSMEIVSLSAVYSSDPSSENYSYSQATPSASLTMTITNPGAFGFFEQGNEYALDFTKLGKRIA